MEELAVRYEKPIVIKLATISLIKGKYGPKGEGVKGWYG
jgi:hypothetical protein